MGCGSAADLLLGAGGMGEQVEDGVEGGRACWGHGGGGGVLGHHHLRAGSIESPPLVVENRGLALPLNPSPGHWAQSIDALPVTTHNGLCHMSHLSRLRDTFQTHIG